MPEWSILGKPWLQCMMQKSPIDELAPFCKATAIQWMRQPASTVADSGFPLTYYYRPQRSCGQGNVFTGVCLSTGGVSASMHAGMPDPPRPGRENPPRPRRSPQTRKNSPRPGRTPWTRENPPGPGRENPPDQGDPPDQGEPPGPGRTPWPGRTPLDQGEPPRPGRNPPRPGRTPPDQGEPPRTREHTVNERPVRILLECILVWHNFCQKWK